MVDWDEERSEAQTLKTVLPRCLTLRTREEIYTCGRKRGYEVS